MELLEKIDENIRWVEVNLIDYDGNIVNTIMLDLKKDEEGDE